MLYTAKCFWPGVTEDELRLATARVGGDIRGAAASDVPGALYLPDDELVLCLFEASSRASVKHASEHASMPCERVIESVWVVPPRDERGKYDPSNHLTSQPKGGKMKGMRRIAVAFGVAALLALGAIQLWLDPPRPERW